MKTKILLNGVGRIGKAILKIMLENKNFEIIAINEINPYLENIRKTIEKSKIDKLPTITCSFGGTIYENNEQINDTIKRADEALYIAKANGKNKVILK